MYWKFIFVFSKIIYFESSMKISSSSELMKNIISKQTVENCLQTVTDKSAIRINELFSKRNYFCFV